MAATTIVFKPSFEEAERIQKFLNENYTRLLALYPEQFVAVKDGEVVATNHDLAKLVYQLSDLGLSPTDVMLEFITAKALIL